MITNTTQFGYKQKVTKGIGGCKGVLVATSMQADGPCENRYKEMKIANESIIGLLWKIDLAYTVWLQTKGITVYDNRETTGVLIMNKLTYSTLEHV